MKTSYQTILIFLIFCGFSFNSINAQNSSSGVQQDSRIPELMVLKAKMTENNELGDRYKIQLFYGDLKGANKVEREFKQKYNQWPVSLHYETPNYKVWVGDFRTKLEAERAFVDLKSDFKSAIVFRP